MMYTHVAVAESASRQDRRELGYDLADEGGWQPTPKGKKRVVNGKTQYRYDKGKGSGGKPRRSKAENKEAAEAEAFNQQQREKSKEFLRQKAKESRRRGQFSQHAAPRAGETQKEQAEVSHARRELTHVLTKQGALQTASGGGGSKEVRALPADALLMTAFDAWQKEFLGNSQMMDFEESETARGVQSLIQNSPTDLLEDAADYVSRVIAKPLKAPRGGKRREALQKYLTEAFAKPRKPVGYDREEHRSDEF